MSQREGSLEDHQTDSSFSFLPHLEAKIRQTHNLARLLTKYADQLLEEYVQQQGEPFGLPGFSPPRLPLAGLSGPAPSHAGLPVSERLRQDAAALSALPALLDAVRRRQAELNPRAPRLLRSLEDAARQVRALGAAVETVLAALGAAARGPVPEPVATSALFTSNSAAGVFSAKVLGLHVCGLYGEWCLHAISMCVPSAYMQSPCVCPVPLEARSMNQISGTGVADVCGTSRSRRGGARLVAVHTFSL
uniref:Cardiotrophin 1 n=1 Tax=Rattus norvegicus TaxID=10116 RepID=A0ABK0LJV0_RAT